MKEYIAQTGQIYREKNGQWEKKTKDGYVDVPNNERVTNIEGGVKLESLKDVAKTNPRYAELMWHKAKNT